MTMVLNQKPFTYSVVPPGKPSNCCDSVRGAQGLESKTDGEMRTPTNRNSRRGAQGVASQMKIRNGPNSAAHSRKKKTREIFDSSLWRSQRMIEMLF